MMAAVTQNIGDAQKYEKARKLLNAKVEFARQRMLQGYNDEVVLRALKDATAQAALVAIMAETLDI